MTNYTPAWPHTDIEQIFENIFMVKGTNKVSFEGRNLQFSRNMHILREGRDLTLINTVRLTDSGLQQLDALGAVKHIVRIGAFHGRDDAFYLDKYHATFWALANANLENGETIDQALSVQGPFPISDAQLIMFNTSKFPEALLLIQRQGGILISCDSLQNMNGPDQFFDQQTAEHFKEIGMFNPAGIGKMWLAACQIQASDIEQLQTLTFKHLLSAHGDPLLNNADKQLEKSFTTAMKKIRTD